MGILLFIPSIIPLLRFPLACAFAADPFFLAEAIVAHTLSANGTAIKGKQDLLVRPIIRACMVALPNQLSRTPLGLWDEKLGFERRFVRIGYGLNRCAAWVAKEGEFEIFKSWAILKFLGYRLQHSRSSFLDSVFLLSCPHYTRFFVKNQPVTGKKQKKFTKIGILCDIITEKIFILLYNKNVTRQNPW